MGVRSITRLGRRAGIGLAGGLLIAATVAPAALAADPVGWQAAAGTSTRDEAVQVNAFLPKNLTVDVGDSINWTVKSGEFHTITFPSGTEPPPFIVPINGVPQINPAAAAPSGGPTYDGSAFANSGLLFGGQQFSLGFTKAGTYSFLCLIHAGMAGTVHVQDAGASYPASQATWNTASRVAANRFEATGRALQARSLAGARSSGTVAAGAGAAIPGAGSVAVMRFLPSRIVVHAGQSVTWVNNDPETPHTVTFGEEPGGGPLGSFFPGGLDGPGHATISSTSQSVNSGFTGAPFLGTTFSATFTAPGTYHFICALHDDLGMTGDVVVLP
jgi:plastocyanin